jgi:hypothetical protein
MLGKHTAQLFVALLILFSTLVSAQNQQSDRDAKRQQRMATYEALRKPDGVHQAAKLNGGIFHMSGPTYGWVRFTTLESLAESSDMAFIGIPTSSENKLIDQGRSIVTEYKMNVQEPIQGKVNTDQVVAVDLPGGKVEFDDGSKADLELAGYPRLEIGHKYVIYLQLLKPLPIYEPTGGPEGIFELKPNGKVSPFATPEFTQAAAENDDGLEFIEKVRFASKYQKKSN